MKGWKIKILPVSQQRGSNEQIVLNNKTISKNKWVVNICDLGETPTLNFQIRTLTLYAVELLDQQKLCLFSQTDRGNDQNLKKQITSNDGTLSGIWTHMNISVQQILSLLCIPIPSSEHKTSTAFTGGRSKNKRFITFHINNPIIASTVLQNYA